MEIINTILSTPWALALAIIVLLGVIAAFILLYVYKRDILKKWLLEAVTYAEQEIGSGRGAEKLKLVHSMLITKFPVIGRVLPFAVFSELVDKALEIMRAELEKSQENIGQN